MVPKGGDLSTDKLNEAHATKDADEGPEDDEDIPQRPLGPGPVSEEVGDGIRQLRQKGSRQDWVQDSLRVQLPSEYVR